MDEFPGKVLALCLSAFTRSVLMCYFICDWAVASSLSESFASGPTIMLVNIRLAYGSIDLDSNKWGGHNVRVIDLIARMEACYFMPILAKTKQLSHQSESGPQNLLEPSEFHPSFKRG